MRLLVSARVAIAIACLVTAGYLWAEGRDARQVERANELALSGRYEAAIEEAMRVEGPPADVRALSLVANARFAEGRLRAAADAFARLARRDPDNWVVHLEWGRVLFALGRRNAARKRFLRAQRLNPALR